LQKKDGFAFFLGGCLAEGTSPSSWSRLSSSAGVNSAMAISAISKASALERI
jgi:hypothetical protein